MTKEDWIAVGLKLLGVYFGVLALASIFIILSTGEELATYVHTVVYMIVAFVLIRRTAWCLRFVCPETREYPTEDTD